MWNGVFSLMAPSDIEFSKLRGLERLRGINQIEQNGMPIVGPMDVLSDKIEMRHTINVDEELQHPEQHLYTIGLHNMLLSKAQYIMDAPKNWQEKLEKAGQAYRILSRIYPYYNEKRVLIGMEEKDIKDVAALLLDHEIGEGKEAISVQKIVNVLNKDKKLALTVRLNLLNLLDNQEIFERFKVNGYQIRIIKDRLEKILKQIPEPSHRFNKPWWNTAVETPLII
jgi:hypothetical protein